MVINRLAVRVREKRKEKKKKEREEGYYEYPSLLG
jgi:hypothetical protein